MPRIPPNVTYSAFDITSEHQHWFCNVCGAVVHTRARDTHKLWHARVDQPRPDVAR